LQWACYFFDDANYIPKTKQMETLHIIGKDIQIKLNGATIYYDDFGNGEMPVIFIHGFPFSKSMWADQMEYLKDKNRVIAYDIRGYGKSTAGDLEQSISLFADDLISFMDALQIEKAIVCGFSMGGYILLNAATRYATRFAGLILCDTQCISDSPEVKDKRSETIESVKAGKMDDFTETFLTSAFSRSSMNMKPDTVDKARKIIHATSLVTIAGGLTAILKRTETYSVLDQISVRTLILCGSEDKITPVEQAELLHGRIKNSVLYVISNAAHMSNLEQRDEFNIRLGNFIENLTD